MPVQSLDLSQGGWPTWANMPWDRRKPCAMPPQWCHKSPVDVKQFYNMTAPNWGSSLSISSWIHMNVSQTTNISTHWLMIPSQVINQWATSVVYGWYCSHSLVVQVLIQLSWTQLKNCLVIFDTSGSRSWPKEAKPLCFSVARAWKVNPPAMWWSPSYPHLTLRKEQQRGLLCSRLMSRLS